MERFAIRIDKKLKTNLFKICRLCGIDNPNKVSILDEVVNLLFDGEDELPLSKKILNCIGIQVTTDDKMPKTICALCYDKINDFHEFREMCYSTNNQTRKLLGLSILPKVELQWNTTNNYANSNLFVAHKIELPSNKRSNKRKTEDIPGTSSVINCKQIKLEAINPMENINSLRNNIYGGVNQHNNNNSDPTVKIEKKSKKLPIMFNCTICQIEFCSEALRHSHLLTEHVPLVARYHCVQCNETISNTIEIKNHNLWHKLSKTPFKCGRCEKTLNSIHGLNRHLRECTKKNTLTTPIIPDIKCKLCTVEFQTKTLFYMHDCIIKKLRCPKCNCKMSNQTVTMKHIATCPAVADYTEEFFTIKNEYEEKLASNLPNILNQIPSVLLNNTASMVVIPSTSNRDNTAGQSTSAETPKKKKNKKKSDSDDQMRRCDELLKTTMKTLVSIKHEPADDVMNVAEFENSKISENNLNSDPNLVVRDLDKNNVNIDINGIKIKQEVINEAYRDCDTTIETIIKQEIPRLLSPPSVAEKSLPILKLKIKKEHGTLNSSFIQNNDDENGENGDQTLDSNSDQHKKKSKKQKVQSSKSISDTENNKNVDEATRSQSPLKDNINNASVMKKIFPLPIQMKQERIDSDDESYGNSDMMEIGHQNEDYESDNTDAGADSVEPNRQEISTQLPIISNIESDVCIDKNQNDLCNNIGSNENLSAKESNAAENNEDPKSNVTENTEDTENNITDDNTSATTNIDNESPSKPMMKISCVSSGILISNVCSIREKDEISDDIPPDDDISKDMTEISATIISKESSIPQIVSVSGGVTFPRKDMLSETDSKISDDNLSAAKEASLQSLTNEFDYTDSTSNYVPYKIKQEICDPAYDKYNNNDNNRGEREQAYQQEENTLSTFVPTADADADTIYNSEFVATMKIKQEIEISEECFGDEAYSDTDENYESDTFTDNNYYEDIEMQPIKTENIVLTPIENENLIDEHEKNDIMDEEISTPQNYESLRASENITKNIGVPNNYDNENKCIENIQIKTVCSIDKKCTTNIFHNTDECEGNTLKNINTDISKDKYDNEIINDKCLNNSVCKEIIENNPIDYNSLLQQEEISKTSTILDNDDLPIECINEESISQSKIIESNAETSETSDNSTSRTSEMLINFTLQSCSTNNNNSSNTALKNVNEIAENHNNENMEKLLRNENTDNINLLESVSETVSPQRGDSDINHLEEDISENPDTNDSIENIILHSDNTEKNLNHNAMTTTESNCSIVESSSNK